MRNLQLNGIDMVLGSNHRSGQIFYAELLVLCFEVNFSDMQEGLLVSCIPVIIDGILQ